MRNDNELARELFGTAKKIAQMLEAYGVTTTVDATAKEDSEGGFVLVDMGGATVSEDEPETDDSLDEVDPDDPDWETVASNENVSPLLDSDPDDPDAWVSLGVGIEPLDEGWSRVTYDNSGGAMATVDASTPTVSSIEDGKTYTLLLEVRPHISSDEGSEDEADGTGIDPDDVYDDIEDQVAADETEEEGASGDEGADDYTPVASIVPTTSGSQFEATSAITLDEQTTYVTLTATSGGTSLLGTQFVVDAGEVMDVEVRMSLYEGEYAGEYVPYGMEEGGAWQLVPCSANIKAGDTVQVTIKNGVPIDATSTGWGDDVAATASQAEAIATATGQHFWADDNGIHVSTDENDSEGANNILINSLGILLREYADVLLELSSAGVIVGDQSGTHLAVDSDSVDIMGVVNSAVALLMSMGYDATDAIAYLASGRHITIQSNEGGSFMASSKLAQLYAVASATRQASQLEATDGTASAHVSADVTSASPSAAMNATSGSNSSAVSVTKDAVWLDTTGSVYVNNSPLFVYEDKSVNVPSTASGTNYSSSAISVLKTGYAPVACIQTWFSSGTRQNFLNDFGTHVEAGNLYVRVCNLHSSQAASGTMKCRILYVKTELF